VTVSRKRSDRVPLTRDRILESAMGLADEDGIESLTMRRLAEQLEVEAMSLYHHLPNKNAILDELAERVFQEIEAEVGGFAVPPVGSPWVATIRPRILGARRVMLRHRWAPGVMEARGVMTPTMVRYVDAIVGALHAGGISYDLIHHGLHALGSTMFGFSQELMLDSDTPSGEDMTLMQDFVPNLAAMLEEVVHDDPDSTLGWCDDQTEFEFGLDILLEGLERRRVAEAGLPTTVEG
jgi:AcrR family transcriptional regulator